MIWLLTTRYRYIVASKDTPWTYARRGGRYQRGGHSNSACLLPGMRVKLDLN
jgi:hypothetical protein